LNVVLIFDENQKCTTGLYIYKELKKMGINVKVTTSDKIKNDIKSTDDLVLAIDDSNHYILDIEFYPKAIWLIDTHLSFICDKVMAECFDFVFVAQKDAAEKLKNKIPCVYWLPLAGDVEYHGKKNVPIKYDISFIGNLGWGKRRIILSELINRYPNNYIGHAECEKIGEIYSASKIVVNYSIKNDINMRIFEAMCAGSLLITNQINNGLDEIFVIGNELITYNNTLEDLIDKINYYLKHESEREKIAKNGFEKVINFHTYYHRVKFILNQIERNKKTMLCIKSNKKVKVLKLKLKLNEIVLFITRGIITRLEKVQVYLWLALRSLKILKF